MNKRKQKLLSRPPDDSATFPKWKGREQESGGHIVSICLPAHALSMRHLPSSRTSNQDNQKDWKHVSDKDNALRVRDVGDTFS